MTKVSILRRSLILNSKSRMQDVPCEKNHVKNIPLLNPGSMGKTLSLQGQQQAIHYVLLIIKLKKGYFPTNLRNKL
jgi:hypothetical protein